MKKTDHTMFFAISIFSFCNQYAFTFLFVPFHAAIAML